MLDFYLHVQPIVDGELLAFLDIKEGGDRWNESVARMFRVRPLAVGNEAVVQLVRQRWGVVLRRVELVGKIFIGASYSAYKVKIQVVK